MISGLLFLVNAVLEGAITTVVVRSIERMNPALAADAPEAHARPVRSLLALWHSRHWCSPASES